MEPPSITERLRGSHLQNEPVLFAFDSEFSIVADPAGGEVASRIDKIVVLVTERLGIQFNALPGEYRVDPSDGRIMGYFRCTHDVIVPLGPAVKEEQDDTQEIANNPALATQKATAGGANGEANSVQKAPEKTTAIDIAASATRVQPLEGKAAVGENDAEKATHCPGIVTSMSCELQVAVMWDRSHPYFPGMRTIIRFRMIG